MLGCPPEGRFLFPVHIELARLSGCEMVLFVTLADMPLKRALAVRGLLNMVTVVDFQFMTNWTVVGVEKRSTFFYDGVIIFSIMDPLARGTVIRFSTIFSFIQQAGSDFSITR